MNILNLHEKLYPVPAGCPYANGCYLTTRGLDAVRAGALPLFGDIVPSLRNALRYEDHKTVRAWRAGRYEIATP